MADEIRIPFPPRDDKPDRFGSMLRPILDQHLGKTISSGFEKRMRNELRQSLAAVMPNVAKQYDLFVEGDPFKNTLEIILRERSAVDQLSDIAGRAGGVEQGQEAAQCKNPEQSDCS